MTNKPQLKPLFKYAGGKGSEVATIKTMMPSFTTYIEPFIGGGALYWNTQADNYVVNDLSNELVFIYKYCQTQNTGFLGYIEDISNLWQHKNNYANQVVGFLSTHTSHHTYTKSDIDSISKQLISPLKTLPKNSKDLGFYLKQSIDRKNKSLIKISKTKEVENLNENALGALGFAIYSYLRNLYNNTKIADNPELKTALYLYLREYAFSSMFRFNNKGEFNVPFGGNSYAKKSFLNRYYQMTDDAVISKLLATDIKQGDFSDALIDEHGCFIFLDPPYDTAFSTYNLQEFNQDEQIRLRDELSKIKHSKWMMVVKSTEFIEGLYDKEGWYKTRFNKNYSVNFLNRNKKDVKHLVITNYPTNQ